MKYPLTEKQKNLLRSLAQDLQNGQAGSEWNVVTDRGQVVGIKGYQYNDGEDRHEVWKKVTSSDFAQFVVCGFLRPSSPGNYTLDEYLIVDAAKNDFEVNEWMRNGIGDMGTVLPLTPKQLNLLESLASDLQSPSCQVKDTWTMMLGDGGIATIQGLGDNPRLRETWNEVEPGDFTVFAKYGFFIEQPPLQPSTLRFTLDKGLVLDAYKRRWKLAPKNENQIVVNVHGDVNNSNIIAASTLNNVQQSISSSTALNDDAKAQLSQLIGELKEALAAANLSGDDAEEAEVLAHHAQIAVEQLNAPKPNKKLISISVDGLEKAAKNLERVAVPVAAFAVKIALILRSLTM